MKLGSTRTVIDIPDGRGGRERHSTRTCLATYEDAITGDESVADAERFFETLVDACIPGLTEEFGTRLSAELDRDVEVVSPGDPATAAAEGAARIAEHLI